MGWQSRLNRGKGEEAFAGGRRPLARSSELVVEQAQDELLVYDEANGEAHCLSPAAARVWRACDGYTMIDALANKLELDDATVTRALEELETCNLLDAGPTVGTGSTRRELTMRMAKVGGVVAAAPLIYSIVAPTPALAASEKFCLALCPTGCGSCQTAGCCCCDPGGGFKKICAIDCSHCASDVANQRHCNENITSVSCSSGC